MAIRNKYKTKCIYCAWLVTQSIITAKSTLLNFESADFLNLLFLAQ